MGNPESKPKNKENNSRKTTLTSNNLNSQYFSNPVIKTDLFKRFSYSRSNFSHNLNKNNDTKNYSKFIKPKSKIKEFLKNDINKLVLTSNIINNIMLSQINQNTNLNFLLINNINNLNLPEEENQKFIEDMGKSLNSFSELNKLEILSKNNKNLSGNIKNKINYELYKSEINSKKCDQYENEYQKVLHKFELENIIKNEIKIEIKEDKKDYIINTVNSNKSISMSTKHIQETPKSKNDYSFDTSPNNMTSNNSTINSTKDKEMKVVRLGNKKDIKIRSNSNGKNNNKNENKNSPNHSNNNIYNSPKNSKLRFNTINSNNTSPKIINENKNEIISKINININKNLNRISKSPSSLNINKKIIINKNNVMKIDLRKKVNSLNENFDNKNIHPNNIPYKKKINSQANAIIIPKINNSKNSSLSTIRVENSSFNHNATFQSVNEVLKINKNKIDTGSYAEKERLKLKNQSKSPTREKNLTFTKSAQNLFDNKNKNEIMFKIDLSKEDENETTNYNTNIINKSNIPQLYSKPPINKNLEKLNKLKNLKSYLSNKKNKNEEDNNLDEYINVIREVNSQESEIIDKNRFSFQRRQTPQFDILKGNQSNNSGERFSFNQFGVKKSVSNNEDPKIKLNFEIDSNIDENDFKDIDDLEKEDESMSMSIAQITESDFELSYQGKR